MGQLEKYGLYVLCLLIFLIIGVSIWGEPASAGTDPNPKSETARVAKVDKLAVPRVDIKELTSPVKPPPSPSPVKGADAPAPLADVGELSGGGKDAKKSDAPKNEAKEPAKTEPKAESRLESGKRPTHRIKSGDTFESIAIGLGDKKLVPMLLQLNPKLDPKVLAIGTEVQLPTTAEIAAHKASANGVADAGKSNGKAADGKAAGKPADGKPADDPKKTAKAPETAKPEAGGGVRTYTIAQGDTLSGLAKRLYGSDKRVDDIKGLNPSVDPTRLRIGQVIKLPAR